VLEGVYETERAIPPKLAEFESYLQQKLKAADIPGVAAEVAGVGA
jgi:hypothetical protein